MNVLVDTSVWSLALHRAHPAQDGHARELAELVSEGRASLIGPIRQELLSGVRAPAQFKTLREHLRPFPDLALDAEDYEEAAHAFNLCRSKGIQGSNTDFLICAAASRRRMPILSTDDDFQEYARLLPISLHPPR